MFTSFFDDANSDGLLQREDVDSFLERFRVYSKIDKTNEKYLKMNDVIYAFYDCLTDHVRMESGASSVSKGFDNWADAQKPANVDTKNITLNQWLNMWGRLCRGAAGISGFPIWVKLLGIMFFETIDRDGDGEINFDELKNYYKDFVGVKPEKLDEIAKEGFRVLTANNGYVLNQENYLFCFANFLLGRGLYGPGKYIFGVFDNREISEDFRVLYHPEEKK